MLHIIVFGLFPFMHFVYLFFFSYVVLILSLEIQGCKLDVKKQM